MAPEREDAERVVIGDPPRHARLVVPVSELTVDVIAPRIGPGYP